MVTMFISMWISNAACTAMMCPIIQAVLEELQAVNKLDTSYIQCYLKLILYTFLFYSKASARSITSPSIKWLAARTKRRMRMSKSMEKTEPIK